MRFPLKPVHGDALTAELAAAGVDAEVYVVGDEIQVVTDAAEAKVRPVFDAHKPPTAVPVPSLVDRLAAVEARLDKAANAAVTGEAAKLRDGLRPVT